MTNALTACSAPARRTNANTTTCRRPCGASAANTGTCSGGWERGLLMSAEEIQIRQIEENIAGIERRIASLRVHRSADTNAKILELEQIVSDLEGHLEWHKRRAAHESE